MGSPLLTLRARIRFNGGACRELDIERWLAEADDVDHRLLDRVQGPVIDIGCGPGRHVEALTTRQVDALGIDLSRDFVALAQARDRRVLLRSVFDPLPREAAWRSALLLDGSIGIGGNPAALLRRVGDLLVSGGRALIETAGPDGTSDHVTMSLESQRRSGFLVRLVHSWLRPMSAHSPARRRSSWPISGRTATAGSLSSTEHDRPSSAAHEEKARADTDVGHRVEAVVAGEHLHGGSAEVRKGAGAEGAARIVTEYRCGLGGLQE